MQDQRNKPVGNKDTQKEAAEYLTKYKAGERERRGRRGRTEEKQI